MMATKQQPKHVADLLNSKVVFWLKNLHFWFVVNTAGMAHIKKSTLCVRMCI
jgi:hypothetical protein